MRKMLKAVILAIHCWFAPMDERRYECYSRKTTINAPQTVWRSSPVLKEEQQLALFVAVSKAFEHSLRLHTRRLVKCPTAPPDRAPQPQHFVDAVGLRKATSITGLKHKP